METFGTLKVSIVLHLIMSEIDNRDRILEMSRDMFFRYGIRCVSMDDIAGALAMSKKTIYQYYADKEALVQAVIRFKITESQCVCEGDRNAAANAIEEMFLAMEMVEQMFRTMNPSVLFDLRKYHPAAYAQLVKHKDEYLYNIIRTNLEWGIREELYRPEINADIIARFRIDSMLLPLDPAFLSNQKATLADIQKQVLEHYLFGIVSLKGYKLALKYQQKRSKQA